MYIERIGARKKKRRIHTTLGELVATISDIAFEYAADGEEAYEIARWVGGLSQRRIAQKRNH